MKVEKFEVEKKSRGFVVSVGFGNEELEWLTEHLKKAVELEASRGFIQKIRGKTMTHLMEICFNSRGCFMKITQIVTKRKPLILVVPESVKGNGWETLRKVISSVQDYYDQVGRVSKETFEDAQTSKHSYRGCRSYAEVVVEDGPRNGVMLSVEIHSEEVGEGNEGGTRIFKACRLVEGEAVGGDAPKYRATNVARVVSVIREDEEDDIFRFESTRSRDELLKAGGCVSQWSKNAEGLRGSTRDNECYNRRLLPRSRYRYSSSNLVSKRENGWRGSLLGPAEGNINGPIMLETLFKAQPVRAQIGTKTRGLPAGPFVFQAYEIVALLSSTFQRTTSSANVVLLSARSQGLIEVMAGGDEAFSKRMIGPLRERPNLFLTLTHL
ncbi:hypothetical protein AAG906_006006 [Vitis piasezkii]